MYRGIRLVLIDCTYTQGCLKDVMIQGPKSFQQYVCWHLVRWDVVHGYSSLFNQLSDDMVADVNMLCQFLRGFDQVDQLLDCRCG